MGKLNDTAGVKPARLRMCAGSLSSMPKEIGEQFTCPRCGTDVRQTDIPSPNASGYNVIIHLIPSDSQIFKTDPDGQDLTGADFAY